MSTPTPLTGCNLMHIFFVFAMAQSFMFWVVGLSTLFAMFLFAFNLSAYYAILHYAPVAQKKAETVYETPAQYSPQRFSLQSLCDRPFTMQVVGQETVEFVQDLIVVLQDRKVTPVVFSEGDAHKWTTGGIDDLQTLKALWEEQKEICTTQERESHLVLVLDLAVTDAHIQDSVCNILTDCLNYNTSVVLTEAITETMTGWQTLVDYMCLTKGAMVHSEVQELFDGIGGAYPLENDLQQGQAVVISVEEADDSEVFQVYRIGEL